MQANGVERKEFDLASVVARGRLALEEERMEAKKAQVLREKEQQAALEKAWQPYWDDLLAQLPAVLRDFVERPERKPQTRDRWVPVWLKVPGCVLIRVEWRGDEYAQEVTIEHYVVMSPEAQDDGDEWMVGYRRGPGFRRVGSAIAMAYDYAQERLPAVKREVEARNAAPEQPGQPDEPPVDHVVAAQKILASIKLYGHDTELALAQAHALVAIAEALHQE